MSNYAMTLFIQRLTIKKNVKWTKDDNKNIYNSILPNLITAKRSIEIEIEKLIKDL